jgi:ubiquinone/menaquinone biosynthesis C-methylase UbiE
VAAAGGYYATGEGLRAKHALAEAEGTRDLVGWALGLAPVEQDAAVLDAGCGWGRFTWGLIEGRGHAAERVVCVDRSEGMVGSLLEEAEKRGHAVRAAVGEVDALPLGEGAFDLAMANFVLYFLADVAAGARELARVVRPGGRLLVAVHSGAARVPVIELHYRALDRLGVPYTAEPPAHFTLENGRARLAPFFVEVESHAFEDEVVYRDAATFRAAYETIGRYRDLMARDDVDAGAKARLAEAVEELAAEEIAAEGALRAPRAFGAFVCRRAA